MMVMAMDEATVKKLEELLRYFEMMEQVAREEGDRDWAMEAVEVQALIRSALRGEIPAEIVFEEARRWGL
jgi:hypothetical protein